MAVKFDWPFCASKGLIPAPINHPHAAVSASAYDALVNGLAKVFGVLGIFSVKCYHILVKLAGYGVGYFCGNTNARSVV